MDNEKNQHGLEALAGKGGFGHPNNIKSAVNINNFARHCGG
jgi:hypothetical protein